jgi:hypothetical protein
MVIENVAERVRRRPPAWRFQRQPCEAGGLFMPQIIPILFGFHYIRLYRRFKGSICHKTKANGIL